MNHLALSVHGEKCESTMTKLETGNLHGHDSASHRVTVRYIFCNGPGRGPGHVRSLRRRRLSRMADCPALYPILIVTAPLSLRTSDSIDGCILTRPMPFVKANARLFCIKTAISVLKNCKRRKKQKNRGRFKGLSVIAFAASFPLRALAATVDLFYCASACRAW